MTISLHLPFLFHIVIELPASIAFFLHPSATLATAQPHADAIIRQYALLLTSSNLIAWAFLFQSSSSSSRHVAAALALYHVGPIVRAWGRIRAQEDTTTRMVEGWRGPRLHLAAHGICLVALMGEALQLW